MKKEKVLFIIISAIILIIDQITKYLISLNKISLEVIKDFFYLSFVKNNGIAFSMLKNLQPLIILISVVMLIYLIIESMDYVKRKKTGIWLSLSFIIGGLLGNLVDRIRFGYVIDFIDFRIFNYGMPIFNISDIFLVLGAFILIWFVVKDEKNENNSRKRRNTKKN